MMNKQLPKVLYSNTQQCYIHTNYQQKLKLLTLIVDKTSTTQHFSHTESQDNSVHSS